MTTMNFGHAIQHATLLSLLMGGLGVVVAVLNHRVQVKTQIFLAMSAQYDELLKNSSAVFWLSVPVGTELPRRAPMAGSLLCTDTLAYRGNVHHVTLGARPLQHLRSSSENHPLGNETTPGGDWSSASP